MGRERAAQSLGVSCSSKPQYLAMLSGAALCLLSARPADVCLPADGGGRHLGGGVVHDAGLLSARVEAASGSRQWVMQGIMWLD